MRRRRKSFGANKVVSIFAEACLREPLRLVSKILGVEGTELDVSIAFGLLHGTSPRFSDAGREEYADRPFYARGTLALTSEAARSRGKRGRIFMRCMVRKTRLFWPMYAVVHRIFQPWSPHCQAAFTASWMATSLTSV